MELDKILSFATFLNKFREVERQMKFSHNPRAENDAEHCWQLAYYLGLSSHLINSIFHWKKYCNTVLCMT